MSIKNILKFLLGRKIHTEAGIVKYMNLWLGFNTAKSQGEFALTLFSISAMKFFYAIIGIYRRKV